MPPKPSLAPLVSVLERALVQRNIREGFAALDEAFAGPLKLDPRSPDWISFLLCLAQWTDLGYRNARFLDDMAAPVELTDRVSLSAVDFFKLKLIESYRQLAAEQLEQCIDTLDLVLRSGAPVLSGYLIFLANFWKGRAHRKRGDYEQAHTHLRLAQEVALEIKGPRLVAVTQIHESWLAFQKGERAYAFELLDAAEKTLRPTGHALSLGNIESARGRFVRRSGEYARALTHFEAAIAIYSKRYAEHPNLARALVNAAYVKRLIALDLRRRRSGTQPVGSVHAKSLEISREALALLEQAGRIYSLHDHQGGTGSVLVNAAHLHLESGDIAQAAEEARRAFALGEEKRDIILMARARIVESSVELAHAEEQLGDDSDIARHANLAVEYAMVAIQLALKTENKRLLAEAYIARGHAAADEFFQEWEVAKDYASKAATLLSAEDKDHLFNMLGELRSKLLGATRVDETLRLWSDGQLGGKTFQQVQEEFAELVIPRVWLRHGKNTTLVAKTLSISPKKIRRILRHVSGTGVDA